MGTITVTDNWPQRYTVTRISTNVVTQLSETMQQGFVNEDTKTDRSRSLKPSGWLYPKAYQRRVLTEVGPFGTASYREGNFRYKREGCLQGFLSPNYAILPVVPQSLVDQAVVEALLQLKDQKFNAAQAFAERQQTADLVGDTATKLARAYRYGRQGKWSKAAKALGARPKKQTSNWLELQYGWKPLLGDVYGSAEALAQATLPQDWRVTVKATRTSSLASRKTVAHGDFGRSEVLRKGQLGCFVRLDYVPTSDFLSKVKELGLTNPLQLQWELVPYSFVVDWFLPIGDWLSSMDAALGFEFLSGSLTRRVDSLETMVPYDGHTGSRAVSEIRQWSGRRRYLDLQRSVYHSSPLPHLPRFKNPFSATHMLNGLALLAEAFGRR